MSSKDAAFRSHNKLIPLPRYRRFLIQSLKFQAKHCCAKIVGTLMVEHFKYLDKKPDALMAAPLHNKRLIEHGFNQFQYIAQHLHQQLDIPLYHYALTRTLNTTSQTSLNTTERRKNIKNSFYYRPLEGLQTVSIIKRCGDNEVDRK
jgi:predicted amidophosphoribosyltransferase